MKDSHLVFVLVVRGANEAVRPALSAACGAAGWEYVEDWGGELPPRIPGVSRLLVSVGGVRSGLSADASVVIAPATVDVAQACAPLANGNWAEAARMASAALAEASSLVGQGAALNADSVENIDLPFLGPVSLPAADRPVGVQTPKAVVDALAIFPKTLGSQPSAADWATDFLLTATDPPMAYSGGRIDMIGRARLVLFGPFFTLPPGNWRITVEMEIDPVGTSLHLGFDWGTSASCETVNLAFDRPGLYRASIVHRWDVAETAQFRIWVKRAAFLGYLSVSSMKCDQY